MEDEYAAGGLGGEDPGNSDIQEEDKWQVIEAYFSSSTQVLVQQQLDSFDTFLMTNIVELVQDTSTVHVKCEQQNPQDQVCHICFAFTRIYRQSQEEEERYEKNNKKQQQKQTNRGSFL